MKMTALARRLRASIAAMGVSFFVCGAGLAAADVRPLDASDWHAKWIGLDGVDQTNLLEDAYPGFLGSTTRLSWIWFPVGEPEKSAPPGTVYFRREIVIPTDKPPVQEVHFQFAGDSECRAWINGFDLGVQKGFGTVKDADITYRVKPGTNVLCLAGINIGPNPKPAGVAALVRFDFIKGDSFFFWTDDQWKVSNKAGKGWNALNFDDSKWVPAKTLGLVGMSPWGNVRAPESRRLSARYLRKDFLVGKEVARAMVYFSGLGWSELYLNGEKVGDAVLSPGVTDYSQRVFYVTHDVTKQLRKGTNALGAILGNGTYYAPRSEVFPGTVSYGWPKMLLQLRVEYLDGSVSEVVSDESWKLTTQGPIRANNEYDGEEYDANYDLAGWNRPGFDAISLSPLNEGNAGAGSGSAGGQPHAPAALLKGYQPWNPVERQGTPQWQPAQIAAAPAGELVAQTTKPIRVKQTLKPVALTEPKPGVFVFDLGRNMVGWCRLKVAGQSEDQVVLRHAETLKPDGTLNLANNGGLQATDIYTLRGTGSEEVWEPRFTYHRFRYVEVTGYPGKPTLDSIEGRVLNADLKPAGKF